MSDIVKSAIDAARARDGKHVLLLEGSIVDDSTTVIGCSCGFRCESGNPDDEFTWHIVTIERDRAAIDRVLKDRQ